MTSGALTRFRYCGTAGQPTATPVEPTAAPLTCPPERTVTVDFDTLPDGTPITPGTFITDQFKEAYGFDVTATRFLEATGEDTGTWARIFDSSNPTGNDRDLGSPNKNCAGCASTVACPGFAGQATAGFLVANVTNCVAQNNILIIEEGDGTLPPDDARFGTLCCEKSAVCWKFEDWQLTLCLLLSNCQLQEDITTSLSQTRSRVSCRLV